MLFAAVLAGCASLHPDTTGPATLQEKIRAGTAAHEGDAVRVVTRDGVSRTLVVTAIRENTLLGHGQGQRTGSVMVEIPIDDILALEVVKEGTGEQAAHLFGGFEIIVAILFFLAAAFGLG